MPPFFMSRSGKQGLRFDRSLLLALGLIQLVLTLAFKRRIADFFRDTSI